jgi:hypothetical protein
VTWATFKAHAPNELQLIPLALVNPSPENVRLFVERQSLEDLRLIYRAHKVGVEVMLPDAPILRFKGFEEKKHQYDGFYTRERVPVLEILAGERRITAATLEEVEALPCRVVTMTDEEAYRFILAHNDVAGLSTAELAYRAAEMDRLGFPHDEISAALKGASPGRYIAVGEMIDAEWFTDETKLCDPSIVEWFEAAQFGPTHLKACFKAWNAGLWDEKTCSKQFRQRGVALPLDNAERGLRVTYNGNRLVVRGQIDLDYVDEVTADQMLSELAAHVAKAQRRLRKDADFGFREVVKINPNTVEDLLDDDLS